MSTAPIFVVVFGAPGSGKTTLLTQLREAMLSTKRDFEFLLLDEPTQQPEIVTLLKKMYEETEADIAAGRSVAAEVQTKIMQARFDSYMQLHPLIAAAHEAARAAHRILVVVADGHLLTDDKLYVRSKFDGGQISGDQLIEYSKRQFRLLYDLPGLFACPQLFIHLAIEDDVDGAKHHHRVCGLRKSDAEVSVDTGVFARLAQYAAQTCRILAGEEEWLTPLPFEPAVARIDTDGATPYEVVCEFITLLARYVITRARAHTPPLNECSEHPRCTCHEGDEHVLVN